MREIRTLRAMWRALETGFSLKIYAPALDPTGHLRHSRFMELREDKKAKDVVREMA